MKYNVIAPAGDSTEAIFVGMREFPTERIILLVTDKYKTKAEGVKKDLEKFKIPVLLYKIKGDNLWEGVFKAVSEIVKESKQKGKDYLVNVASGDRTMQCAATSASFVNGIKAFNVNGNSCMLLPVMKFSYYKMLSDKKLQLLQIIAKKNCCASLEELSKKSKMSFPLISYHINGNLKSEGLKDMGLVETENLNNKIAVHLTSLGRMVLEGHVDQTKNI